MEDDPATRLYPEALIKISQHTAKSLLDWQLAAWADTTSSALVQSVLHSGVNIDDIAHALGIHPVAPLDLRAAVMREMDRYQPEGLLQLAEFPAWLISDREENLLVLHSSGGGSGKPPKTPGIASDGEAAPYPEDNNSKRSLVLEPLSHFLKAYSQSRNALLQQLSTQHKVAFLLQGLSDLFSQGDASPTLLFLPGDASPTLLTEDEWRSALRTEFHNSRALVVLQEIRPWKHEDAADLDRITRFIHDQIRDETANRLPVFVDGDPQAAVEHIENRPLVRSQSDISVYTDGSFVTHGFDVPSIAVSSGFSTTTTSSELISQNVVVLSAHKNADLRNCAQELAKSGVLRDKAVFFNSCGTATDAAFCSALIKRCGAAVVVRFSTEISANLAIQLLHEIGQALALKHPTQAIQLEALISQALTNLEKSALTDQEARAFIKLRQNLIIQVS